MNLSIVARCEGGEARTGEEWVKEEGTVLALGTEEV